MMNYLVVMTIVGMIMLKIVCFLFNNQVNHWGTSRSSTSLSDTGTQMKHDMLVLLIFINPQFLYLG